LLLLHVERVAAVWCPGLVGDNSARRWLVTWSRATAKSDAEQKRRERKKGKGREPYTTLNKVCLGIATTGGDRRLCTLD
jgi:hypothetical protein